MGAHKLFCNEDILEEILLMSEDHLTVYNIIDQFCDVVLNNEEEEIFELIKVNPLLKALFKRENAGLLADKGKFKNLAKEEYENFLNDILILDLNEDKTKDIRDKYGILAINLEETFIQNQNYHYGYSIDSTKSTLNCWSELFTEKPLTPLNSAIIIDNFLWSDVQKYSEENNDNIYPILNSIVPDTLDIPFHLMIVLQNKGGNLTKNKAKEIIKKMKKKITSKSGVEISLITQTDTKTFHERVILTNYHYIYSHKGFIAFDKKRIKNETNGDRNWVFKDIDNYIGEIQKHKHISNAHKVHELIKKNKLIDTNTIFNEGFVENAILSNFN
ncbi:hypothetical protein [Bizionia paragorgiae]|uniref:Uncharacterized protein n=1 Tax=Bizionia paragorgiae TaxID=283786 RepID=A0A1H3X1I5_BIZPA|nr:hypothetical protein [Bizionia paragorgiae]SDZ93113.1 hypothetical protein SAMN04487990_104101 [Bizionia paragorgiae]